LTPHLKVIMQSCRSNASLWQSTLSPSLPRLVTARRWACFRSRPTRPSRRLGWLACIVLALCGLTASFSAWAHGDLELRILTLTRQIAAATNNPAQLYLERGELQREHANWEAASADYARAAQLDPSLAAVDLCRAQLLADSGKLEAALPMFDKAMARSPAAGEAFVGRARVLVKLGRRSAALADYQRALDRLAAPAPEDYLEWAQLLVADAQLEPALRALEQGIKKLGPLVKLQAYALEVELSRKNHTGALARLDSLIANASRKEGWLAKRGDVLSAANRPAEARQSYEASLEAINKLPSVLREGPAMQKLQAQVVLSLAQIKQPSAKPKTD
jgi:tetratricopeptide (TPR) repeat protein